MKHRITVEVGAALVAPAAGAASRILAAVEESNRAARLDGLEDSLNPRILDPERVQAMLEGLSALPAATLEWLGGSSIRLDDSVGVLGSASPVSPAALRRGFTFERREGGPRAPAVLQAALDVSLARRLIQSAREAVARFDDEVRELENLPGEAGRLRSARRRRCAAALVWRSAAAALAEAKPWDNTVREEARQAGEATAGFVAAAWLD